MTEFTQECHELITRRIPCNVCSFNTSYRVFKHCSNLFLVDQSFNNCGCQDLTVYYWSTLTAALLILFHSFVRRYFVFFAQRIINVVIVIIVYVFYLESDRCVEDRFIFGFPMRPHCHPRVKGGTPLYKTNGDVPLDGVVLSRLE